ncbi:MAG: PAS domain S-box protein [Holophagaceae bacterium]|nr:PAS domain S-box protein [Holophagaceae bacterium]
MSKPRILIVEDEPFVARDIRKQLEELGYDPVADTPRAEDAITLAERLRPDLVLMDIRLEGEMDGIAAAQVIHERFNRPVVFLTAYASEETLDRAKKSNPFGYIIKPFEERELRTVIEMALYKHRAETLLREGREEQAAILRTALDGFWLVDLQGRIMDVNEACCRMLGYTRDEMLGKTIADFEADESAEEIAEMIGRIAQTGSALLVRRHRCKDGRLIHVELSITQLPGVAGRFSAFLRDITERRKSEDELRIATQRITLATDAASIGVWDWDILADQWYATPNYYTMLGYEPETGFGDRSVWIERLHPDDREAVVGKISEMLAGSGKPYQYEARIRHADGSYRWVQVIGRVVEKSPQGQAIRMLGVRMDISEQKRAEQALRENEDRYRDLVDNSPELISTYDLDGNFISVNDTTVRLTGYSRETLLKMNLGDLLVPGTRHLFPEYLRTIREFGKADGIMQIQTIKGERRFWEYTTTMRTEGVVEPIVRGLALDITERRQAEKALRASESQLQVILESTGDGILAVDLKGKVLKTNQRFAQLWQIPQVLLEGGDDRALLDHVLAQLSDPDAFLKKVHSLYASDAADLDLIQFKDGRCFERFSSPMLDGPTVTGRVWSFRDITERRRAEERLRLSDQTYRGILDSVTEAVYIQDENGVFLDVNLAVEKMYGYAKEEFLGRAPEFLSAPGKNDLSKIGNHIGKAFAGEPQTFEFWGLRKDGAVFPKDVSVSLGQYFGEKVIIAVARDITERKQAERELVESHERFELANRATFDVIWDWDLDAHSIWRNDNFEKLFGYSREEVETDYGSVDDLIHPEDLDSVRAGIQVALENRASEFWADQYRLRRKDGSYAFVEDQGFITRDADGRAVRMLGAMQDISERKQAERALRENEEKLRLIIEHSKQLYYSHRPDNVMTYVSPQVREFFDAGPEDTFRPWTDFMTDNPVNAIGVGISNKAVETGVAQGPYELELVTPRGRTIWVQVNESPVVEHGKTVAMVGALTDITESKRAHDQLRLQGGALEAAANAILITDRQGLIQWTNPAFSALTGYSAAEAIGREPGDLVKSGKHDDTFYKALWDTILGGKVWRGELINKRKDGSLYIGEKIITPLKNEAGEITNFIAVEQDISERKKAEASLRLQGGALEAAANAIVITDREGVIQWANAAFTTFTGYTVAEAVGRLPADLIKSGKHDRAFYKAMWDTLILGEVWRGEVINKRKNGSLYTEEMTITPLKDDKGEITHFVAVKQDITARKQAELERQATEARVREQASLLDKAHDAISVRDMGHRILFWNKGAERLYGWNSEELIGRSTVDLFYDDPAAFHQANAMLLHDGEWSGRIQHRRKDGNLLTVEGHWTLVRDELDQPRSVLAINTDITERVEAEQELYQYTERLKALREIDAALLGARSTPELTRSALSRLRHIVPFERASVVLFDQGLAQGTIIAVDQDNPWLPLAGEVRPIGDFHDLKDLLSAPFLDLRDLSDIHGCAMEELMLSQGLRNLVYVPMESEGAVMGFVALSTTTPGSLTPQHAEIALDMTDQLVVAIQHTRLKEELERSNQQLESKVDQRTADLLTTVATMKVLEGELRKQEAEARAASEAKSRFLASMSHELRTPLIGVTGMLEILTQSGLSAEQRQVAAIIHESSESLLQIIGDILDFSKIEANKLDLAVQTFSLRALVNSVSQTFSSAISTKGLKFIVEVDPRIAQAHVGDMHRLRQILNNFMSNAVRFTERGSITLRVWRLDRRDGAEFVALQVQDTGIGISQETQAHLFEPFTQAEASTTRRFGGTGLGLAISRRLADLMGGSLDMQSALEQGTTLTLSVELPLGDERDIVNPSAPDEAKAVPARPAPSTEEAEREGSLILMAEDHPTNRIVLTQQVNRAGYALEIAVDGQEAFEKWQSGRYALLLTDLHMPRMDGYQLTKAVRDLEQAHGRPRTPILALTANALRGEAERCVELGMDDYLVKPVTIPLLASKLREWLPHVKVGLAPEPPGKSAPPPPGVADWVPPGLDAKTLLDLCRGDDTAAREILEKFISATKTDLLALEQGLRQKDNPCIVRQSHRIKGSAAMIGARDIAGRAERLELYAQTKAPAWEAIEEQISGLQTALARLEGPAE